MITQDIEGFISKIERNELVDKILISPFNKDQAGPAGYDLHVGREYKSLTTGEQGDITEDKPLIIEPGETVAVVSKEYIGLPQNIIGIITSKMSLLVRGIPHMSTRADPGFYGRIVQIFTNVSTERIELKYEEPFCHIIFLRTDKYLPELRYKGDYINQQGLEKIEARFKKRLNPRQPPTLQEINRKIEKLEKVVRPTAWSFYLGAGFSAFLCILALISYPETLGLSLATVCLGPLLLSIYGIIKGLKGKSAKSIQEH
jgi:deoxycytidine triphosphate deaminase